MATTSHRHLMPLRTRVFAALREKIDRRSGANAWTPEAIATSRRQVLPSTRPTTWVTGAPVAGVRFTQTTFVARDAEPIPVRIIRPSGLDTTHPVPVLIYFHGGGWTLSNPANYDPLTSYLADALGAVVVAPDYRKAPQHQAPRASHDAFDTLTWVASRPAEVGADGPIAVAGDSAGGNLSAVVTQLARDTGGPALVGQALIYPATDLTRSHPSAAWRDEAILSGESMDHFLDAYLAGSAVAADDPIVSPLHAASLANLPPALVQTAECDPLVDEGEHYAELLTQAGVPVRLTRYAGMPHGFISFPGATTIGRQAREELVNHLRGCFAAS
ncbi:alpha/beta hydrolase [Dermacoccaceae bacterium W4C1]